MTQQRTEHFSTEWELKAYIQEGEHDPCPHVTATLCLLHAEETAGWWRLEFVDQAFATKFPYSQRAFESMARTQRRRFVVAITFRDVEVKCFPSENVTLSTT